MTPSPSRQSLDVVTTTLLCMASAVDDMLVLSLKAFLDRDAEAAKVVIASDDAIDAMDNTMDELCLRLLALEQPVAADLRYVVAAMRLTGELERVADEACIIAEHTLELWSMPPFAPHPEMRSFTEHTLTMFRQSVDAFRSRNPELAKVTCGLEDAADDLNLQAAQSAFAELEDTELSARISLLRIFIARSLERICDLATNICELTVFAYEGEVIKHKWQMAGEPPLVCKE